MFDEEFDEDRPADEDGYNVELARELQVEAGIYDEGNKVKPEWLVECVEHYISKCHEVVGRECPAASYLRLIPWCGSITEIIIAQRPYDSRILPRYSSPFAFSPVACEFWPASVQVLSQAMKALHGVPIANSLEILTHSYLLLSRGVVLHNAYPYADLGITSMAKVASYRAELTSAIAAVSRLSTGSPCLIIEFGDEAALVGEYAWSSTKSTKNMIRRVTAKNPAYIARRFGDNLIAPKPAFSSESIRLDSFLGVVDPRTVTQKSGRLYAQKWKKYDKDQFVSLQGDRSLRTLSKMAREESIRSLVDDFQSIVERYEMPNPGRNKKAGNRGQTGYGGKPIPPEDDQHPYVYRVFQYLVDQAEIAATSVKACEEKLGHILNRLTSEQRIEIEVVLRETSNMSAAMMYVVSFFASAPGVISSRESALSLPANTVPPIIRATPVVASESMPRLKMTYLDEGPARDEEVPASSASDTSVESSRTETRDTAPDPALTYSPSEVIGSLRSSATTDDGIDYGEHVDVELGFSEIVAVEGIAEK